MTLLELLKKIDKIPGAIHEASVKAVRVWALTVEGGMVTSAPVRTGALASTIRSKVVQKQSRITGIVGPERGTVAVGRGTTLSFRRSVMVNGKRSTRVIDGTRIKGRKFQTPTRYARKVAEKTSWYQSIQSSIAQANRAAIDYLSKSVKV